MTNESSSRNSVDELAEEFVERYRNGERPALSEYARRCPDLADKIRQLFPALVMMEQLKQGGVEGDVGLGAPLSELDPTLTHLGDYRILREVGRGGMGVVYEAVQESLGRHVALKVFPFSASTDSVGLKRFQREARSAARLHHTNIVPVFGIGQHNGIHFYAMQFIDGQGLDEVVREVRRMRQNERAPSDRSRSPRTTEPLTAKVQPAHKDESGANDRASSEPCDDPSCSVAVRLLTGQWNAPQAGETAPAVVELALPQSRPFQDCDRSAAAQTNASVNDQQRSSQVTTRESTRSSVLSSATSELSIQSDAHYFRSVANRGFAVAAARERRWP